MMKEKFICLSVAATLAAAAVAGPVIPRDEAIEQKVEATLARMTLDEKIGQMTELAIDLIAHRGPDGKLVYHPGMLDSIVGKYKVGSILNAPQHALTPGEWNEFIGKIQDASMREIGIPCIYGLDQNHGVTYTQGGTLFPQNINVAATFNPALAEEAAAITAYETRATACPWTYSPTVDLVRVASWPRVWENFGEDPYLSGVMGAAQIRGFQGTDPNHIGKDKIATSVKHYMGYGAPFSGQDRTPAVISEADLHRLWSVRPAEIFNLPLNRFEPGDPADFFLFDPEEKWTVSRETLYSKSYNTPFLGREMQGRVRHHWLGGVQLF